MSESDPASVLLIKPSSLGDVVTGIPVLRGLRRTFPQAHLAWLVTPACAGILDGLDELDERIRFDRWRFGRIVHSLSATRDFLAFCRGLRRRRFDWAIDLQGLFRSGFLARVTGAENRAGFADAREGAKAFYTRAVAVGATHTIDRNIELARALGVDARPEDLWLKPGQEAKAAAGRLAERHGLPAGAFLLAVPGTRWPTKLYPPRLWRRVLEPLAARMPVAVVGSEAEKALCDELAEPFGGKVINLAGQTPLAVLVALTASAAAVVCCDSAANFIAPAVGVPSVTLIGPTRPERTGPVPPLGEAVVAETPCQGCLKRRCGHVTCMQVIDPQRVIRAVEEALGRPAAIE